MSSLTKAQKVGLICGGAVLFFGVSGFLWAILSSPGTLPDPSTQDREQILDTLVGDAFTKRDMAERQAYLRQLRDQNAMPRFDDLGDDQRQQLRGNLQEVRRQEVEDRMDAYFEAPPEQRVAMLDQMIDRMQDGGGFRGGGRFGPGRGNGQGQRRGLTPDRMQRRLDNTTPEQRAKRSEFIQALRQRMEQRGVNPRNR